MKYYSHTVFLFSNGKRNEIWENIVNRAVKAELLVVLHYNYKLYFVYHEPSNNYYM